jgi:ATP-binding cassette, subfamily B, bacterial CvaB/MchF/RaxB
MLLLDEATSHLDLASEASIVEAVRAIGVTRIIVAHRPQTIASADRVIELRRGQMMPVVTRRADGEGAPDVGILADRMRGTQRR